MPTEDIKAPLIAERDKLNKAIEALQGPRKEEAALQTNAEASTPTVTNNRRGVIRRSPQSTVQEDEGVMDEAQERSGGE